MPHRKDLVVLIWVRLQQRQSYVLLRTRIPGKEGRRILPGFLNTTISARWILWDTYLKQRRYGGNVIHDNSGWSVELANASAGRCKDLYREQTNVCTHVVDERKDYSVVALSKGVRKSGMHSHGNPADLCLMADGTYI
jgi:hypothetical protein